MNTYRIRVDTESILSIVRPGEDISEGLYVVVWEVDLSKFEDRPATVFTLEEWRTRPRDVRLSYRTRTYRASDPLAAYREALVEQNT